MDSCTVAVLVRVETAGICGTDVHLAKLENDHRQGRFANEFTDRFSLQQANEALEKSRFGNGETAITP